MRLLFSYLTHHKWTLVLALVLATVNQVFSLLDPQIFRMLVDNYASRAHDITREAFVRGVLLLLAASVGVAFVSRVAKNFQDYFVNAISQRVGTRMYAAGVAHAFALPYAVFEDQRSGELLQKLQKARTDAQTLMVSGVNTVFLSLVGILFVIGYAFMVHWAVGVVYICIIPTLGAATLTLGRRIKRIQKTIVTQTSALAGSTTETLRNVELVKSLGLEDQEVRRLNDVNTRILTLELEKVRAVRTLNFLQGTLINALRSGLMFLMLWLIATTRITLGEFFSLLFYSFAIFMPLGEFGTVAAQYQEAKGSIEILEGVLRQPPEPKPTHPVPLGELRDITYDAASFTYASGAQPVLHDVRITIKKGETVAFVGPSGSGKTTMIKLLVGLYHPTGGALLINGINGRDIDAADLRKRIGLVAQETQLFAGTIRENLLFSRADATDAECLAAMEASQAHSILARGGEGLETKIGEGGLKLSGGERQRLAIARALLRNPDLVIFDEATSSLDSLTEKAITGTIRNIAIIRPELMTVLVAHRLSTVLHATRIFVLEHGRVVEQGTHAQLLAIGGLYAALWREQIAEEPEGTGVVTDARMQTA